MAVSPRFTEKVSLVSDEDDLRKRGYILGHTLGEGSYAKVKSAFSERASRKVALKIINRRKAPKDFQQKFLPRELDVMKIIRHPNIIQLYEVMQFSHKVYIAMELAGHGDLLEYIKLRGAIPEEKARSMFTQLVHAVEYLHNRNIIHRDLKCENILLDNNNVIKVSDFGFARILLPDEMSKTFCGSAAYAAPEILQGIPYIGASYDIWSMGVILYIMVCGSMPYDDSNIKKMIKNQTERKVGFSSKKKISDACKELIHKMLHANVKCRATTQDILRSHWILMQYAHKTPEHDPIVRGANESPCACGRPPSLPPPPTPQQICTPPAEAPPRPTSGSPVKEKMPCPVCKEDYTVQPDVNRTVPPAMVHCETQG